MKTMKDSGGRDKLKYVNKTTAAQTGQHTPTNIMFQSLPEFRNFEMSYGLTKHSSELNFIASS